MRMGASAAIADKLLRQAGSSLSQSTYCKEYASFPRDSTRLSRNASPRFRQVAPCSIGALARLLRNTLESMAMPYSVNTLGAFGDLSPPEF
jgi:hypothetical protein